MMTNNVISKEQLVTQQTLLIQEGLHIRQHVCQEFCLSKNVSHQFQFHIKWTFSGTCIRS